MRLRFGELIFRKAFLFNVYLFFCLFIYLFIILFFWGGGILLLEFYSEHSDPGNRENTAQKPIKAGRTNSDHTIEPLT